MVEVSLRRRVTSVRVELAPRGYGVTESPGCLDTWCHPVRANFLPLQMPPLFRLCGREVGRAELVGDLLMP